MLSYDVKTVTKEEIINRGLDKGIQATCPGSKSITNRALLIAALAEGKSILRHVLFSDDSRNFIQSLIDLGFEVEVDEENCMVSIVGLGGSLPKIDKEMPSIYVGSAGTAARFLTAYLGLCPGRVKIESSEQMKKRPMKELLDAMFELGASIEYLEEVDHFPFIIGNDGMMVNEVTIDIDKSSQFLSALLITSVLFKEDFTIHVTGNHGFAYIDMTIQMMEQFGVVIERKSEREFFISKESRYQARDYEIEPDLSAACYFYAMGALLHIPAKVNGVKRNSMQGDLQFLSVLEQMGCTIREDENEDLVLMPSEGRLKGGIFDLSSFSDQALTLAAIAPFCDTKVVIKNVGHIRLQECDRMKAIVTNISAMGGMVETGDKDIIIMPTLLHGATIETFEDHRVAMAFSLPGLLVDGIKILNPLCCKKTFENYFEVFDSILYN